MLPTGDLLIFNISNEDSQFAYKCRTHHRLTQEVAVSTNLAVIHILGKFLKMPILKLKRSLYRCLIMVVFNSQANCLAVKLVTESTDFVVRY